jgi:DNA-binding MarR family transcriptional regulator
VSRPKQQLVDAALAALPGWTVRVAQLNETVAHAMGVTPSELQCLFVLSRRGTSSPGEIAHEVGLTTGAASRLVDRLLRAGLVTRDPDPHDRRRVVVAARPEALDRVQELYAPLNHALREHLTALSAEALEGLVAFATAAEETTARLARG